MESQEAIVKTRTYNPRIIGGSDTVEFTFDYATAPGLDEAVENIREFTTLGDKKKKQAEDDKYRFTITWFEPTNNVPERLYAIRAGSGDRTVTVTYVHSIEIIGRANLDAYSGGAVTCYIAGLRWSRTGQHDSKQIYRCSITLQEV